MPSSDAARASGPFNQLAVEKAHWAMHGTLCDINEDTGQYETIASEEEDIVRGMLAAALRSMAEQGFTVVALPGDREALIEKAAAQMAMCDVFQQSRSHYRHHASLALAALGLNGQEAGER
jgi:hypothetical protein